MDQASGQGQIITFYSYKGGTGRSMALANCACLLARGAIQTPGERDTPKRVLAIDWDLEAPGLHRYFQSLLRDAPEKLFRTQPGVVDAFVAFDEATAAWESVDRDTKRLRSQ